MKTSVFASFLVGSLIFGASALDSKEPGWDLRDRPVDNYEMQSAVVIGDQYIAPHMRIELIKKTKSVMVSLCGPEIVIESGADRTLNSLGTLSVQNLEKMGWLGKTAQVINGKVVLRVETDGVKEIIEKSMQDYLKEGGCNS